MSRINVSRVILGGLAAGLVANVCDMAFGLLLYADMDLARQRLGISVDRWVSDSVAITWIVVDFILGLTIVSAYAAVRPRLGPGPKTAATVAIVLYFAIAMVIYGFVRMGVFTSDLYMKWTLLSFVTATLAGLAGGYVYRE